MPAATSLAPMLRRRTQRLGRMALESLFALPIETPVNTPVVFASRHGETHRSFALIRELETEGSVSPQSFSLSVHNATIGLYTIARASHANVTALSGCSATASALLIEAQGLLADGAPSVLVVASDEVLPDCYSAFADEPEASFAWAAELVAGNSITACTLSDSPHNPALPELLSLLHFLIDARQICWSHPGDHLGWRRQEQR